MAAFANYNANLAEDLDELWDWALNVGQDGGRAIVIPQMPRMNSMS